MNKGKICVSVYAETAGEFIENIKRAEKSGDVVELRFDFLAESELENALEKTCDLKSSKNLLLTFRPEEQGGKRVLTKDERERFWCSGYDFCTNWADAEIDMVETVSHWLFEKIICSYHDFSSTPENLSEIYKNLKATNADVLKIAVQAGDITDSLAVWKLLEKAKSEDTQIIPIAMGEAGKWTRILGLAHGAFMTYAALDAGRETASGQLTAKELSETYRVKELDENTEIYGIVGNPVAHSISPEMHNAAFKFHNRNAVYIPFEAKNLDAFIKKFVRANTREINLNFKGFSVTIPHKQAIFEFLDEVDETAKTIGAVNTVKIENGRLFGYNTDAEGFIEPLKTIYGDLSKAKVAVLGAGGAARACVYALKQENASITIFARDLQKGEALANEFQIAFEELANPENQKQKTVFRDFDILVNATPLGTKGEFETKTPAAADQLEGLNLIYDLVYNPFRTRLLEEADKANVPKIGGLAMLVAQGAAQQKIWTGLDAPVSEMSRAALEKLK
ncbi:MAG TPA: shikimate dehydrogenase [Pyrinomonadaceae bacterium]|jgi:3-dehydroquinate dehydratase/shikimate dehydrogenase